MSISYRLYPNSSSFYLNRRGQGNMIIPNSSDMDFWINPLRQTNPVHVCSSTTAAVRCHAVTPRAASHSDTEQTSSASQQPIQMENFPFLLRPSEWGQIPSCLNCPLSAAAAGRVTKPHMKNVVNTSLRAAPLIIFWRELRFSVPSTHAATDV